MGWRGLVDGDVDVKHEPFGRGEVTFRHSDCLDDETAFCVVAEALLYSPFLVGR